MHESSAVESTSFRLSSTVTRECRSDGVFYVKKYHNGSWGSTPDIVRARTIREADVIGLLHNSGLFRGRLSVPQLASVEPDTATLVTAEILGSPLDGWVYAFHRSTLSGGRRRAIYLAGKWLKVFQTLRCCPGEGEQTGEYDPEDLVEYCDIRLRKLQSLGCGWVTVDLRDRVLRAVEQLRKKAPERDDRRVWCHGDYAPGNMIWDGRVLTPIDFAMANLGPPLLDVTYFIHRWEMLRIYFPWKRWPIELCKRAFLRGYGRPDAEESPMYRALMIRHLLCRLQTYVRRPPKNLKQRIHNAWVRRCVRTKLIGMLE